MKLSEGYVAAHCIILSTFCGLKIFQNKEVGEIVGKKEWGNQVANVSEK